MAKLESKSKIFTVQPLSTTRSQEIDTEKSIKQKLEHNSDDSKAKQFCHKGWMIQCTNESNLDEYVDWKFTDGLYGFLTLGIAVISPFSVTLLPVNNVLIYPEYWYEILFSTTSFHLFWACSSAIETSMLLGDIIKKGTLKLSIDIFLVLKTIEILAISFMHLICSDIVGYYEPIPFRYLIMAYLCGFGYLLRLWFLYAKYSGTEPKLRKRGITLVWYGFWTIIVIVQLNIITNVLGKVERDVQWLVALILPLTKEINDRIIGVAIRRAGPPENQAQSKFIGKIVINVMYSYCIAVTLANLATKATEYVLLGINFFIDMSLCYKAIRIDKKVSTAQSDTNEKQGIRNQVLTELIPLAFMGAFCIAYYGPNANILGNVGCEIWQYKKIEDFRAFIMPVAEMALIDTGSVILAGISLWWFCRINLWTEYCKTIKKYWVTLAFRGATFISLVNIMISKQK